MAINGAAAYQSTVLSTFFITAYFIRHALSVNIQAFIKAVILP